MSRTTATSVKEFQDRAGDGRNIKFGDGNCIGLLLHTTQSFTTFCLHKILVHYASCYFGVPFHFSLRKILRTHRNGFTPSSHNKKHDNKCYRVFYGAGNVVVLETISHLLKVVKSEEYQWVEFNLQKLIA